MMVGGMKGGMEGEEGQSDKGESWLKSHEKDEVVGNVWLGKEVERGSKARRRSSKGRAGE